MQLLHDDQLPLLWNARLQLAGNTAAGICYLHHAGIVHQNIQSDTVYVDQNLRVKITNVATGRISATLQSQRRSVGTMTRWLPPEVLARKWVKGNDLFAIDAYSFAIVLWEIWTRTLPWAGLDTMDPSFESTVTANGRPILDPDCADAPVGYRAIMHDCWHSDPASRPPFDVIIHRLSTIRRRSAKRASRVDSRVYEDEDSTVNYPVLQ